MGEAGCPVCAESLARLDVTCAVVEQPARGAVVVAVPELEAAVVDAIEVFDLEVELTEPGQPQAARFFG